MNTNEFSIQRFGLLLKSELTRNLKDILIITGAILGLYIISPIGDGRLSNNSFVPYIGFVVCILPFLLYKNLFHTTKGVTFGLLPASQTEKFLVIFSICTLIVPIGMLFFAWFVSLIGVGLTGDSLMMFNLPGQFVSHEPLGFFDSFFWTAIGAQSISIWGVCFFKSRKFWKTVLTLMCAALALVIIAGLYSCGHDWSTNCYIDIESGTRIALIADVFATIVVPVALWVWSFLKLRRQQF